MHFLHVKFFIDAFFALFLVYKMHSCDNCPMQSIKENRQKLGLTQSEMARRLGISLRSYSDYENNKASLDTPKGKFIKSELEKMTLVDEEHGVLTVEEITEKASKIFSKYNVSFCYLFGSYAKGKAKPTSDVDLIVSTTLRGLDFVGLIEELREELCKKIDLINAKNLAENPDLLMEVLKDGIKIYEQ